MTNKTMISDEKMIKVTGGYGTVNGNSWVELGDGELAELLTGSCPDCHKPLTIIDQNHRRCDHCHERFEYRKTPCHGEDHMAWVLLV